MATSILVVLWIVLGVVAGALAPVVFKRPAPFGRGMEYIICIVTTIVVGFLDRWALSLPAFQFTPPMPFIVMMAEPFVGALLVLWIARQLKRPSPSK